MLRYFSLIKLMIFINYLFIFYSSWYVIISLYFIQIDICTFRAQTSKYILYSNKCQINAFQPLTKKSVKIGSAIIPPDDLGSKYTRCIRSFISRKNSSAAERTLPSFCLPLLLYADFAWRRNVFYHYATRRALPLNPQTLVDRSRGLFLRERRGFAYRTQSLPR